MRRIYPDRTLTAAERAKRWREKNPVKVKELERNRKPKTYNPITNKLWREKAFSDPIYREHINEMARARRRKIQEWLRQYKTTAGCKDCGYNKHHAALEFDHIRGKKMFNICNAKTIQKAQKEITKCDVVCANCHKVRTFNRIQADPTYSIQCISTSPL